MLPMSSGVRCRLMFCLSMCIANYFLVEMLFRGGRADDAGRHAVNGHAYSPRSVASALMNPLTAALEVMYVTNLPSWLSRGAVEAVQMMRPVGERLTSSTNAASTRRTRPRSRRGWRSRRCS